MLRGGAFSSSNSRGSKGGSRQLAAGVGVGKCVERGDGKGGKLMTKITRVSGWMREEGGITWPTLQDE